MHRADITRIVFDLQMQFDLEERMAVVEEYSLMIRQWMETNDRLAGWAQFAGAMLALLIAIWVPWYQARAAERAVRRAHAERELANLNGVYYLLADVTTWLDAAGGHGNIPRSQFHDPLEVSDLLERIRLWEAREEDFDRVTALFGARNAVLRVHRSLSLGFLQDKAVVEAERSRYIAAHKEVRGDMALLDAQRSRIHRDRALIRAVWFVKPIVYVLWPILDRWIARREERLTEPKP